MADSWKGRKNPINRDSGSPKARATRQANLRKLRAKEGVGKGEKSAFDEVVKIAKMPKGKKGKTDADC